jgi:hypothetical protein
MKTKNLIDNGTVHFNWEQPETLLEYGLDFINRFYNWGIPVIAGAFMVKYGPWWLLLALIPGIIRIEVTQKKEK